MSKKDELFCAVSAIDCVHSELGEISEALQLFGESMEREGFQTEKNFEEWKAIQFAKRFHLYLSSFDVICRDLARAIDELKTESDTLYAAIAVQNEENLSEVGKA